MIELSKGMLAKSLAGHDKDSIYIILDIRGDYVFLINGETRTIANPKKKRRKHIQPIHIIDEEFSCLSENEDSHIRKFLQQYKKSE